MRLVCVGRMKAGAERDLCSRYLERARQAGRALGLGVELLEIPESRARSAPTRKADEAGAIRFAITDKSAHIVAFDETGRPLGSEGFAGLVRTGLDGGVMTMALVIGGPDGLDPTFRDEAAQKIALGGMTWPHQLARIMVAEQMYRAITILSGHPYHRA